MEVQEGRASKNSRTAALEDPPPSSELTPLEDSSPSPTPSPAKPRQQGKKSANFAKRKTREGEELDAEGPLKRKKAPLAASRASSSSVEIIGDVKPQPEQKAPRTRRIPSGKTTSKSSETKTGGANTRSQSKAKSKTPKSKAYVGDSDIEMDELPGEHNILSGLSTALTTQM